MGTLTMVPSHGTLAMVPSHGYIGYDTFTWVISSLVQLRNALLIPTHITGVDAGIW